MSDTAQAHDDLSAYIATFNEEERQELARADAALDLASLLYQARKARKLTQKLAALRSGVRQQAISRWERSHPNIQVDTLRSYLAALGYNLALVITDAETGEVVGTTGLPESAHDRGNDVASPPQQALVPAEASSPATAWHDWLQPYAHGGLPFQSTLEVGTPSSQSYQLSIEQPTGETPGMLEHSWDRTSTTLRLDSWILGATAIPPTAAGRVTDSQNTPGVTYDLLTGQWGRWVSPYGSGFAGSGLTVRGQQAPEDAIRERQEVA